MSTIFKISIIAISLFIFTDCNTDNNSEINKTGCKEDQAEAKYINDKRKLVDFVGIKSNNSTPVNITYSKNFYVSVSGKPNAANRIATKVSDGILVIDNAENCNLQESAIVTVHLPNLTSLKLNGSGAMTVQGAFRDSLVDLKITGSGDININSDSKFQKANITISGSGNIDAFKTKCDHIKATISGSGNIKVAPQKSLNVEVFGSGNVIYREQDDLDLKYSMQGSGSLRKFSKE